MEGLGVADSADIVIRAQAAINNAEGDHKGTKWDNLDGVNAKEGKREKKRTR